MKIHTHRSSKNRQYYFAIVARNGRIISQSEGYKTKSARSRTIARLKSGMATAEVQEIGEVVR